MTALPRIALIATGGTIDSVGADRLDLAFYTEAHQRLPDGELLKSLPELRTVANVEQIPHARMPSYAITATDWLHLAHTVQQALDGPFDGVVVTHGTNTLEETAYFLHLAVNSSKPVVLTGALRPANALSSDGALNLLNAIRVAASPQAADCGCLVVLDDTIHSARQVTKTATFRVGAFRSPDTGPLGYADADGRIILYQRPSRPRDTVFDLADLDSLLRVDIVVSYVGADGTLIDAATAAGAAGLVSAGSGAGRATTAENEAIDRAIAAGVLVCQASRVGSGRVARSPEMTRRRLVTADNLQPWKARILMMLALTRTRDPDDIQQIVDSC